MDVASFLGLIIGTGLIILGIAGLTKNFVMFWSPASIFIVLGGSLAATMISFSMKEVLSLMKSGWAVFKKEKEEMPHQVDVLVELATHARKGIKELEKQLDSIEHPFLKDGIQMLVDGYNKNEIREILETRIENRSYREQAEANVLKTMGKFSPAFGMIGTLIGLVVMLYGMSEIATAGQDPMATLGKGMGAALITTFYGTILSNLVFNPMAVKFETRIEKRAVLQRMLIEGVALLHDRKHPIIVREKLNSYLRPRDWKTEEMGK